MKQKKDQVLTRYIGRPGRFADLINVNCFHGEDIVKPEDLQVLPGETKRIIKDKNGTVITISRFRDILRVASAQNIFIVVGCENQMKTHYAMPVREMLYDALNYTEQVDQIIQKHRESKDWKSSEEFLSGYAKEDRIKPVITMLLYYGDEPWDGSLDLHGLLEFGENEYLKEYVPNYKINLISVKSIEHPEAYQSDLREFFGVMKHASDMKELEDYVQENKERLTQVEEDLVDVFSELLGERKRLKIVTKEQEKKGEKVDMCRAFDQLEERGRQRGIEQGIEALVMENLEEKVDRERILGKLQKWFGLNQEQAEKYFERFAVVKQ
ncbi:MAG: Rpn family recombination-promoting nuclease/putative transposase [Lachnospiraceae bacterium]|nr:Rpn family recombination-promoting nuclease/putative transposase [Lachnospiraceae bacterium]